MLADEFVCSVQYEALGNQKFQKWNKNSTKWMGQAEINDCG